MQTRARQDAVASPLAPATRTLLADAPEGLDALWLAKRARSAEAGAHVHVALDYPRIKRIEAQIAFVAPKLPVTILPSWDCVPYDRVSPDRAIMAQRVRALGELAAAGPGETRLALIAVNALGQRVPPAEAIVDARLRLVRGRAVDREALIAHLEKNGYRRVGQVVDAGEYAVRGGLIDLFPTDAETPYRLDFFGSELDAIRRFDALTQRSLGKTDELELQPASEALLDEGAIERFSARYLQTFGAVNADPMYEAIAQGHLFPGLEHWTPLFYERLDTVFDYLPEGAAISMDPMAADALRARCAQIGEHYESRSAPIEAGGSFGSAPYRALEPSALYMDETELEEALSRHERVTFSPLAPPPAKPARIDAIKSLGAKPIRNFAAERNDPKVNLFEAAANEIAAMAEDRPLLIAASSEGSLERLRSTLIDHGLETAPKTKSYARLRSAGGIGFAVFPLERGFRSPGLDVLAEADILGDRLSRPVSKRRKADKFVHDVGALQMDDFVTHVEHGIGQFKGLVTLEVGGAPHDCLRLDYLGGDKLFVPVENLDALSRYGASDSGATLDKLGGVGWQARKAKVKQRIREMADAILAIAADRALRKGPAIEAPPGAFEEFSARFPHEETEDQLRAIESVVEDLHSGRPMDRLVCGDVGFGKTEVAIRAAFLVAMSGKQVAILAPTTLLARQHYAVFSERLQGLPLRVAQLSRFVSAKDQAVVRKEIEEGKVDIVIGTHAVLSKATQFANLGLVVVDEEQHFGVAHKERLKTMRADVHVLTMTATPIPRTLQMAMGGLKELSIIATPPVDRLAVRTFVAPADPVVIREAILRETYRGGQVFYVCPRVSDQPRLKGDLEKLVPEVKIGVANGKMPAAELERVMNAFYDGEIELLLATNIVESGLDIPRANTLIVHRADMFGLSQLYQLRGRVGRSKARGYAYFTTPADKVLQAAAEKRLSVIQSLDGLGAGFQLASHDLDIRGAGNLLGDEQSGHIKEVGFELYNSMLEDAVRAARARAADRGSAAEEPQDWTPQITVDAAALMPESWIGDLDLRLTMYRKLASLDEADDIEAFAAELIDRFGPMPSETAQLLEICKIKLACKRAHVAKLDLGPKGAVIAFKDDRFPAPQALMRHIAAHPRKMRVRPDQRLVTMRETASAKERLALGVELSGQLAELAALAG